MPHINRRQFLKLTLGATATLIFHNNIRAQDITPQATPEEYVWIPPILMLHSRESRHRFLTGLMQFINDNDYEAITLIEWMHRAIAHRLTERELIITIDDIAPTRGNPSFDYFKRMYEWIQQAGHTAVFGVITRPDQEHDPALWDEIARWAEHGFEFATHTSHHSTFNAPNTSPRRDFTQADYTREIVDSADYIATEFARRHIEMPVQTLITPYGSGWNIATHTIHDGIIEACLQADIKTVVGIVDGRGAIPYTDLTQTDTILYMGRTPPGYVLADDGTQRLDLALTQYYLTHWR